MARGRYLSLIPEPTPGTLPAPYTNYVNVDVESITETSDRGLVFPMRSRGRMVKSFQPGGILENPTVKLLGPHPNDLLLLLGGFNMAYLFTTNSPVSGAGTHTFTSDEDAPNSATHTTTNGTVLSRTLSVLAGMDTQEKRIPGCFVDDVSLRQPRGVKPLEVDVALLSGRGVSDITQTASPTLQTPTVYQGFGGYDFSLAISGVTGTPFRPLEFDIKMSNSYDRGRFAAGDGTMPSRRLNFHPPGELKISGSVTLDDVVADALVDYIAETNSGLVATWNTTDIITGSTKGQLVLTLDKVLWTKDTGPVTPRKDLPTTKLTFDAYNPTGGTNPLTLALIAQNSAAW